MEGNLEFAWHFDPLLFYALSLAGLLFGGIFIMVIMIIFKHGRRIQHQKIQGHFIAVLNEAHAHVKNGRSIAGEITILNKLIHAHKNDVAYGWVSLMEKTPISERESYISIAKQTEMLCCIPHCLEEGGIAEQCVAIEAIGLSQFSNYISEVEALTTHGEIAPYACVALARIRQQDALPKIIRAYEKGVLTTTQALSALVEIPKEQIANYGNHSKQEPIPLELKRYLID